jgi:hypothetical protein
MDDDPVLRSLSDDLERSDPALAALLSGDAVHPHRRHWPAWFLFTLPLLAAALLVPARVTLAVSAMLLILASPAAAYWLCASADGSSRRP